MALKFCLQFVYPCLFLSPSAIEESIAFLPCAKKNKRPGGESWLCLIAGASALASLSFIFLSEKEDDGIIQKHFLEV